MKTSTKILVAIASTATCLIAVLLVTWALLDPNSGEDSYAFGSHAGQVVNRWLVNK